MSTNYPHVFFYKSGNKFLSHLSCSWQQEHNCNAFQHRRRVGLDWRMTHFPFPYFIWLGTLGAVLAKFQSRRLLPPQISHCVINWTHTHIYKKKPPVLNHMPVPLFHNCKYVYTLKWNSRASGAGHFHRKKPVCFFKSHWVLLVEEKELSPGMTRRPWSPVGRQVTGETIQEHLTALSLPATQSELDRGLANSWCLVKHLKNYFN